jgi:hypothetical protein
MNFTKSGDDKIVRFSIGNFLNPGTFYAMFENIKHSLQKEQKDLIFGKKKQK